MTTNTLFVSLLLATGCGAMNGTPGLGDDGSGSGSGSGSDVSDPPGSHPPDQIYGHIKDERGDTIDFSTGEPVHTHAGEAIDLSAGCPAVYHYAYLHSRTPARYGRQLTTNPLAFKITTAASSLDPSATAYRVRTEDNHVLLDWTPMTGDADGVYTMELHRDDGAAMAALGTSTGKMFIDARFRDTAGNETVDTGCWDNHPIAAPLNVATPTAGELFGMTLPANSRISRMIDGPGVFASSTAITQQTAEPINITIKAAASAGTGSQTSAELWIATTVGSPQGVADCDLIDCAPPHYVTTYGSTAKPLAGLNTLVVTDDLTGNNLCVSDPGADLTCTVPARSPGEAPHGYHLLLDHSRETSIDHPNDLFGAGEITIGTTSYTAERLPNVDRCTHMLPHTNPNTGITGVYCVQTTSFAHLIAMDKARIDFEAMAFTISASTGAAVPEVVPYLPATSLTFPAGTWDAGDKGL
jgi:hypothetical protein